jgi:hypothetical protein
MLLGLVTQALFEDYSRTIAPGVDTRCIRESARASLLSASRAFLETTQPSTVVVLYISILTGQLQRESPPNVRDKRFANTPRGWPTVNSH